MPPDGDGDGGDCSIGQNDAVADWSPDPKGCCRRVLLWMNLMIDDNDDDRMEDFFLSFSSFYCWLGVGCITSQRAHTR